MPTAGAPPAAVRRAALAAVLVAAHLLAGVGLPVAPPTGGCCCPGETRPHAGGSPGCGACGRPTSACCCSGDSPARSCCSRPNHTPTVDWAVAVAAHKCHGDGPLGLATAGPAVPPTPALPPTFVAVRCGTVPADRRHPVLLPTIPPDPPPRRPA
jgi:hypothetical protein